jgi:hypothetical protein
LFEDEMPWEKCVAAKASKIVLRWRNGLAAGKDLTWSATTKIAFRSEKVEEDRVGHPTTSSEFRRKAELEEVGACRVLGRQESQAAIG